MEVKQVIKTIIEDKKCPIHGGHPIVGTARKEIQITACCRAFHDICSEQVQSILLGIDGADQWQVAYAGLLQG